MRRCKTGSSRSSGVTLAGHPESRGDAETFTLYVVVDGSDERGLVRLLGTDPTRNA